MVFFTAQHNDSRSTGEKLVMGILRRSQITWVAWTAVLHVEKFMYH